VTCNTLGCQNPKALASPKHNKDGSIRYRRLCAQCCFAGKSPWKKYKAKLCEKCGFVPVHSCQLDVDHIDGNIKNNSISNYQTLCANCHRLKTLMNKDYENRY
jgi:HNH endonuclease